jgi:hypothetical protein
MEIDWGATSDDDWIVKRYEGEVYVIFEKVEKGYFRIPFKNLKSKLSYLAELSFFKYF